MEIFAKFSGLVGEFGEFCEKITMGMPLNELLKEISDVEWYLTRLEFCFELSKEEVLDSCKPERTVEDISTTIKKTYVIIGQLAEKIKKVMRDKNGDFSDDKVQFLDIFCQLELKLMQIEGSLNRSKTEVLKINYDKLKSRWERKVLHGDGDNR